jgi:preprotein translocase subunit SecG
MMYGVTLLVPLLSAPIIALTIILIVSSLLLTAAILIHKGRGGGMSDLFGGGMSTSLGGSSVAERNLDRATVIVGLIWAACIIALLLLYRSSFSV